MDRASQHSGLLWLLRIFAAIPDSVCGLWFWWVRKFETIFIGEPARAGPPNAAITDMAGEDKAMFRNSITNSPIEPWARMLAAWSVLGICSAPLLLSLAVEELRHELTWFVILVGAGMLVATYFRSILKPAFPEMLDRQNPLWERVASSLTATAAMITYFFYRDLTSGRAALYLEIGILLFCWIVSDLRFVWRSLKQKKEEIEVEI